jgi:hypothetical protein
LIIFLYLAFCLSLSLLTPSHFQNRDEEVSLEEKLSKAERDAILQKRRLKEFYEDAFFDSYSPETMATTREQLKAAIEAFDLLG